MSPVMGRCEQCGRPSADGFLCPTCVRYLAELIRVIPPLYDDLSIVRARLARYGEFVGRGNDRSPLPFNLMAADAMRKLDRSVRDCASTMGGGTALVDARLGVVAHWVRRNIHSTLPRLTSAPWHYQRIDRAVDRAQSVCDRPPQSTYAGRCDCGRDLYSKPGETMAECRCGLEWDVEEKRSALFAQIRSVVAPGPDIARALNVEPHRLRVWKNRNLLDVQWVDPGPPITNWYRVGDVQDLIEGTTK